MDILEYGDDAPTPPHIIATTLNDVEGEDMKLLRSELISILQLMVSRLGEEGHENDAIVPVSPTNILHVLFLIRIRYWYFQSCQLDVVGYCKHILMGSILSSKWPNYLAARTRIALSSIMLFGIWWARLSGILQVFQMSLESRLRFSDTPNGQWSVVELHGYLGTGKYIST
jgi:hypothetical protein